MLTADTLHDLHFAICKYPHDLDRRIVYADCCEESGQGERAEFIRLQCRLPHAEGNEVCNTEPLHPAEYCERCRLRRREEQILKADHTEWYAVPGMRCAYVGMGNPPELRWWWPPTSDPIRATFNNGFPDTITCTLDTWHQHGPAIVLASPVVQVTLSDRSFVRTPFMEHGWYWAQSIPYPWGEDCHAESEASAIRHDARQALRWARIEAKLDPCTTCNGTGWKHYECKVCSATPDDEGEIRHGKGCYMLDEDGGGSEMADPCPDCR